MGWRLRTPLGAKLTVLVAWLLLGGFGYGLTHNWATQRPLALAFGLLLLVLTPFTLLESWFLLSGQLRTPRYFEEIN